MASSTDRITNKDESQKHYAVSYLFYITEEFHCMNLSHLVSVPVDGHLNDFYVYCKKMIVVNNAMNICMPIMNNAMNICMHGI